MIERSEKWREAIRRSSHKKGSRNNSLSKYKGISTVKSSGKWRVQLEYNGKNKTLGNYNNEKDAAHIYDYWANKLPIKSVYLNFPNELLNKKEFKKIDTRRIKSSQFIGIVYKKRLNKWWAYATIDKKRIYLGNYPTEEYAAIVREHYIISNNLENEQKLNF